ncbi:MAG: hypothetical protein JXA68_09840 [Ignavibacteriales bacterium]|nr:hypothetical protein [Ignavibacteriales bacterium]
MNKKLIKIIFKISIILLGGLIGYGFYYFIGCNTGSCPITRSPYLSILFGIILGIIFIFPTKKAENE